jgi:hypothetical protein
LFFNQGKLYFHFKKELIYAIWHMEVNCTQPSLLARIPWSRSINFLLCF